MIIIALNAMLVLNTMEIEARVKIEDLEKIKQKLVELGASFGGIRKQEDLYFYNKEEIKNKTKGPGSSVLRIRKSNNNYLTYKAFTEQLGAWEEHEVIIDDPEAMKEILVKSDFVQIIRVAKSRTKGKLDDYELCLDEIEDFGKYLEIALEDIDKQEARKMLIKLLSRLGFEEKDIIHQGYPEMMLAKKGYTFHGMK